MAFIWDFDKTLTLGYMQDPLFSAYGIDSGKFWGEVNQLTNYYLERGLVVSKDTAYLGHILTYVQNGQFSGLTNEKLRELGKEIPLSPGMPDFMARTNGIIATDERYVHHGVTVEHYVVSTGLRQMIEGNPIRRFVKDVWACELLADPPGQGYLDSPEAQLGPGVLSQVGYVLDNTTKTRAVFEINKGANVEAIDVNAQMTPEERRVPIQNMIYIADGPSDVPVFSVVNSGGGRTLGVHTPGGAGNYDGVRQLLDDGRVNHIAEANYEVDSVADLWLMSSLRKIASRICDLRERGIAGIVGPAGHKV